MHKKEMMMTKQEMMEAAKAEMMMKQKMMMLAKQKQMEMAKFSESELIRKQVQAEEKEIQMSKQFGPPVDCVVTAWSPWSECNGSCGRTFRRKFRMVKRYPSEGGKACPRKLERKQKCTEKVFEKKVS